MADYKNSLAKAKQKIDSLAKSAKNARGAIEEVTIRTVGIAETGLTSFALGYARGKMGDDDNNLEVAGVPVDLTGGILLSAASIFMVKSAAAPHLAAVGAGGVACYGAFSGLELGKKAKNQTGGGRVRRQVASGMPAGMRQPMVDRQPVTTG